MAKSNISGRLTSLDALRGFDLFVLTALGPLVLSIVAAIGGEDLNWLAQIFTHKDWEGFSPWDLVMPLFVFMSGASIPFALSKAKREGNVPKFLLRLAKRVALLWLLGMFVQGNLRALDPDHIYLYTNTLQSIAVGYLVSALLFYFTSIRTQVICATLLLLAYWAVMQFTGTDGFGYGNYTPDGNMAEWIDRQILGHYRDQSSLAVDGTVVYATWYHYTWILSSLTFAATALTGVFAGHIAKSSLSSAQKLLWFLLGGAAMVAAGWICDLWMPIIKPIWSSSMVLFSSGWCWLLLGIFFLVYDILKVSWGLDFLRTYGMNSITAYVVAEVINFRGIAHSVFYGLEQYIGGWYTVFLCAFQVGMIYMILYLMKRNNIFLKV